MTSAILSHAEPSPRAEPSRLPYSPLMQQLIRPLQHGFLVLNRWFMAPALRAGLGRLIGNPLTGHLMLLRTRGRRSGLIREAPLGYVILDGAVYCVAGYGVRSPWLLNLEADPNVEVILPGRTLRGRAAVVSDDAEWVRAYRALIASFGFVGHIFHRDPAKLDDATLLATHGSLPVVRVDPVDARSPLVSGQWDPGGRGWLVSHLIAIGATVSAFTLARLFRRPRPAGRLGP